MLWTIYNGYKIMLNSQWSANFGEISREIPKDGIEGDISVWRWKKVKTNRWIVKGKIDNLHGTYNALSCGVTIFRGITPFKSLLPRYLKKVI